MEPLSPITLPMRLVAGAIIVVLIVLILGPIVYAQSGDAANES